MTIEDGECLSGIYIAATKFVDWTVNPVGDEYTTEATFTVKACQDACNVKVQGGLVANAVWVSSGRNPDRITSRSVPKVTGIPHGLQFFH